METLWINRKEAMNMLGISRYRLECIADVGQIRTLQLPGWKTRLYSRKDIKALAEKSQRGGTG